MTHKAHDENGHDAYYEDWLEACADKTGNLASNGERVTVALALRIAHDELRARDGCRPSFPWANRDCELARGAIAGLRAQSGVEEYEDGPTIMLTHYCDIAIYG